MSDLRAQSADQIRQIPERWWSGHLGLFEAANDAGRLVLEVIHKDLWPFHQTYDFVRRGILAAANSELEHHLWPPDNEPSTSGRSPPPKGPWQAFVKGVFELVRLIGNRRIGSFDVDGDIYIDQGCWLLADLIEFGEINDPEQVALARLAKRDIWKLNELPRWIDKDMLRCLDDDGLIEVRQIVMTNRQKTYGDPTPPAPARLNWFSPIEQPDMAGNWDKVLQHGVGDDRTPPWELRLTDPGRAELARQSREAHPPAVPPAGGGGDAGTDRPDEKGYVSKPVDTSSYLPAKEIIAQHSNKLPFTITEKKLGTIVEDYAHNCIRWTRPMSKTGNPMKNRRNVHFGDWHSYVNRSKGQTEDDISSDPNPEELASRANAIKPRGLGQK